MVNIQLEQVIIMLLLQWFISIYPMIQLMAGIKNSPCMGPCRTKVADLFDLAPA